VIAAAGNKPFVQITTPAIIAGVERRKDTPAQARHFLDTLRGLFRWAVNAKIAKTDPTAGIENPQKKKGTGFPAWSEDDVTAFERRWPIGTGERVWLDVLLYTGVRRGDAVVVGRQHMRNGIATLRTEKSQGEMIVSIPILPILQRTLDAGPTGELAFICGTKGKPLTKESFGNLFKKACKQAGLPNRSAHGLRKIAATRAAENGAMVAQLEAIFGWKGGRMASLYTETASRKRLALDAMPLANEKGKSMPPPNGKVVAPARKSK
jgi:integrase